jgi:hypothetical protein
MSHLDLSSMQFGDIDHGPGQKGKMPSPQTTPSLSLSDGNTTP